MQSPFALNSGQPCNGSTLFAGEFGTARVVLDAGARPCSSGGSCHTEFVGDLRAFLDEHTLSQYDVLSPLPSPYHHVGPFMVYRHAPHTTEHALLLAPRPEERAMLPPTPLGLLGGAAGAGDRQVERSRSSKG